MSTLQSESSFKDQLAGLPPQVRDLWQILRGQGIVVWGVTWFGNKQKVSHGKPIAYCPKGSDLAIDNLQITADSHYLLVSINS